MRKCTHVDAIVEGTAVEKDVLCQRSGPLRKKRDLLLCDGNNDRLVVGRRVDGAETVGTRRDTSGHRHSYLPVLGRVIDTLIR